MQKLLILITAIATLFLAACSSDPIVNRLPWVYRIDIQQGNVITQDAVNQLKPGMNKRQIEFVLGTPMVTDPFHADRWDYYYAYKPGTEGDDDPQQERLSLYFEEDRLVHMEGSLQPDLESAGTEAPRQVTVTVPPQEIEDPGILTRMWRWMGFGKDD